MSLISVVIPYFNSGTTIDETIRSIINQTYNDYEIIIVNDGSTDVASLAKLRQYEECSTIIHTQNCGPAHARNIGIGRAKGEFILTLDADDFFDHTYLEKACAVLKDNMKVGVVISWAQIFGAENRIWYTNSGGPEAFLKEANWAGSALFRKQCWMDAGGYKETLSGFEDWDFWITVTKSGWLVHSIPETLFYYRKANVNSQNKKDIIKTAKIRGEMFNLHRQLYIDNIPNEWMEIFLKAKNSRDIYIWGAGQAGQTCYEMLTALMDFSNIKGFVDSSLALHGRQLYGKDILSPNIALPYDFEAKPFIILARSPFSPQIVKQLEQFSYREKQDYIISYY